MLTVTLQVDAPPGQVQAVKEDAALYFERYGDTKVLAVMESGTEQLKIGEC